MELAVRHADAAPITMPPVPGLVIVEQPDPAFMARIQLCHIEQVAARLQTGHRAYVAYMDGDPAGFGWVATRTAEIGEAGARLTIRPTDRYLWDFVTLPQFRGEEIQPRLIAYVIDAEPWAERFWISCPSHSHACTARLAAIGFRTVAALSFDDGIAVIRSLEPGGGALASRAFGVPDAAPDPGALT